MTIQTTPYPAYYGCKGCGFGTSTSRPDTWKYGRPSGV